MLRQGVTLVALVSLVASTACGTTVVDEDEGIGGATGTTTGTDAGAGGAAAATSVTTSATSSATATSSAGGGAPDPPAPTALYVKDGGCAVEAPIEEAPIALAPDGASGVVERLLVVELVFADECTGAGGQHILARAVDDGAMMWLGAHACYFVDPALVEGQVHAGAVLVFEDDHTETIDDSVCIAFPGEDDPLESDLGVIGVAVFPSIDDATAFVDAVGD